MSIEILSWNILSGGFKNYDSTETKPPRIDGLAKVIREIRSDIVSLIDTYRWTEVFTLNELKQIFRYPFVYLDDVSEGTRIKQIEAILKLVTPGTPTIITGDLNTIDSDDLVKTNKSLDALGRKFPGPMKNMESSLNEMKRGEVTKMLVKHGFVDFGKSMGNTIPAKLFPLPTDEPIARLDYAFGNSRIKLEEFKVLTDEKYGNLSDHYPIWMRVSST